MFTKYSPFNDPFYIFRDIQPASESEWRLPASVLSLSPRLLHFALFLQQCSMLNVYLCIEYRVTCFTRVLKKIDRYLCESTLNIRVRDLAPCSWRWMGFLYIRARVFNGALFAQTLRILSTLTWFRRSNWNTSWWNISLIQRHSLPTITSTMFCIFYVVMLLNKSPLKEKNDVLFLLYVFPAICTIKRLFIIMIELKKNCKHTYM